MYMGNFKQHFFRFWRTVNIVVLMTSFLRLGVASQFGSPLASDGLLTGQNQEMNALWALHSNWLDPNGILGDWDKAITSPCTFHCVTCNSENSVIRLDLGGGGFTGQLVPEFGYLTNLAYMEVYNNNLNGPIPEELGNLQNLDSLDIYGNDFSGSIPPSLGNLSSLTRFRAFNNSLSGTIPVSLTNLKDLQVLELMNNELTGEVPNNGSFSALTSASFEGNPGLCGTMIDVPCPGHEQVSVPGPSIVDYSSGSKHGTLQWGAWIWITLLVTIYQLFFCHNDHKSRV